MNNFHIRSCCNLKIVGAFHVTQIQRYKYVAYTWYIALRVKSTKNENDNNCNDNTNNNNINNNNEDNNKTKTKNK